MRLGHNHPLYESLGQVRIWVMSGQITRSLLQVNS